MKFFSHVGISDFGFHLVRLCLDATESRANAAGSNAGGTEARRIRACVPCSLCCRSERRDAANWRCGSTSEIARTCRIYRGVYLGAASVPHTSWSALSVALVVLQEAHGTSRADSTSQTRTAASYPEDAPTAGRISAQTGFCVATLGQVGLLAMAPQFYFGAFISAVEIPWIF